MLMNDRFAGIVPNTLRTVSFTTVSFKGVRRAGCGIPGAISGVTNSTLPSGVSTAFGGIPFGLLPDTTLFGFTFLRAVTLVSGPVAKSFAPIVVGTAATPPLTSVMGVSGSESGVVGGAPEGKVGVTACPWATVGWICPPSTGRLRSPVSGGVPPSSIGRRSSTRFSGTILSGVALGAGVGVGSTAGGVIGVSAAASVGTVASVGAVASVGRTAASVGVVGGTPAAAAAAAFLAASAAMISSKA